MATRVAIAHLARRYQVSRSRLVRLTRWLLDCARDRDPSLTGCHVSIALVDDAAIIPVNEQFVHHRGPTDVISFRYAPLPGPAASTAELVVNVERAVQEARRRCRPAGEELALYLAHGCLHLTGLDDATPAQRAAMQRIQNRWLRAARASGLLEGLMPE